MKTLPRRAASLALLLATASAFAATPAPPPQPPVRKPPPPPGPVAEAMTAMMRELGAATPASMPTRQRLDTLMRFRHSEATAAKLAKIYGAVTPWTLQRLPTGAAAANYVGTLSPLHFIDADGSTVDWAAAITYIGVGADDQTVSINSRWPSFSAADKAVRISMRDMTLSAQQNRALDGLWFGTARINVGSVDFEPLTAGAAAGPRVSFQGMRLDTRLVDHQAKLDLGYDIGISRIGVGADGVDNFRLATRLTGIDRRTMLELQVLGEKVRTQGDAAAAPEQRREAIKPMLQAMTRGAIRSGTALEIDELSAAFHGQTLRASGRIALEGAVESDADHPAALLKKMVLRLHVQAPIGLLREVSKVLAEQQIKAKNKGVAEPQAVAQLAASMQDLALGKMISSGYVRVEGEQLISDIEYKGGLRINGKEVKMPVVPGMPGAGSGAAGVAAASPTLLQARRIDDRCVLPPYPADIVKADAPLQLAMRLIVKADGSVRNVTLSSPSSRPDYDQAVLAAASRCVYIPALRDGQPVDMPVLWKVVREPGTRQP